LVSNRQGELWRHVDPLSATSFPAEDTRVLALVSPPAPIEQRHHQAGQAGDGSGRAPRRDGLGAPSVQAMTPTPAIEVRGADATTMSDMS